MKKIISTGVLLCSMMVSSSLYATEAIVTTTEVVTTKESMMNKDDMLLRDYMIFDDIMFNKARTMMIKDSEVYIMNKDEDCEAMVDNHGTIIMIHGGKTTMMDSRSNMIGDTYEIEEKKKEMFAMKNKMMEMDSSKMIEYNKASAKEKKQMDDMMVKMKGMITKIKAAKPMMM